MTQFRRYVWQAATPPTEQPRLSIVLEDRTEPKVGYLEIAIGLQKQVFGLDISVGNSLAVDEGLGLSFSVMGDWLERLTMPETI